MKRFRLGNMRISIRLTVKEDWTGDPSIFFRILLKDKGDVIVQAARRRDDSFRAVFAFTKRIVKELRAAVDELHLPVYFSFRLVSEQREIKEPTWD